MNKTLFSTVSDQVANAQMIAIAKTISDSTLIMLLITTAAFIAILSFVWQWKDGKLSPVALSYLFAMFLLIPVNGTLLANRVFSILDKSIERTAASLIKNIVYATKNNLAPNAFIEAVTYSASRRIDDPALIKDIHFVSEYCIPRVARADGSKILLTDVINQPSAWNFSSKLISNLNVDPTAFEAGGRLINCKDLIKSVSTRLNTKNRNDFSKNVSTYDKENELQEKLLSISLNTSRLSVIENQIVGEMGAKLAYDDDDFTGRFNVSKSVLAAQALDTSGSIWSTIWSNGSNIGNRTSRFLGNQRSTEMGSLANQISEMQYEIPYIIGRYRVILDLLLFVVIILLGYGWKAPIYAWVGARFIVSFIPVVVYVLGLTANAELIELTKIADKNINFGTGWDEDLVRHCANILSFHQKSVMTVLTLGPLASAFGALSKNKVFSSIGQTIGGAATHVGMRKALTSETANKGYEMAGAGIVGGAKMLGNGAVNTASFVAKFIPFKGQMLAAASLAGDALKSTANVASSCLKRNNIDQNNNGVQPHGASNNQGNT